MHEDDKVKEGQVVHLAGRRGSAVTANDGMPDETSASVVRLTAAKRILQRRRARTQIFDVGMFGEWAWDMLLTLYVQEAAGVRPTRANLAQSVDAPPSVAVRWQDYLERQGLIELTHGSTSGPLHLQLTRKGRDALSRYLDQLGSA